MPENPISRIAIVGPTAVGKTSLAVELCQRFNGEVINADSRQAYRKMDIGTAKATVEETSLAPHHLIDFLEPSEVLGLGTFLPLAQAASDDITYRGKRPILAGGTGQYIWAALEGQTIPEVPPDPEFRAALEKQASMDGGGENLHDRLRQVDPVRADALDARNVRRVIRALEIYYITGQKPSDLVSTAPKTRYNLVLGLTMSRESLYRRIDDRVDNMMKAGLLVEVERLAAEGYPMGEGALDSPGYRELGQHLKGELSLNEAVARTKTQTHRLARRQYAWFKSSDSRITWLDASNSRTLEQAVDLVSSFLEVPE